MATILGFDLGLSSLKTMIATSDSECKFRLSTPYPTYSPRPGWVEQEPKDWINALKKAVRSIPEDLKKNIDAISFSGHMSSVVIVNEKKKPMTKCLTLTDTRGYGYLDQYEELSKYSIGITGNGLSSTHWILKVRWLLDHLENKENAWKVLFAKDFLRLYLCGEASSESTDCGNTGLMDYSDLNWDDEAVELSGLSKNLLPDILQPYDLAGKLTSVAARELELKQGIPVYYGGADMACGALGSGITDEGGDVVITLGSCATMLTTMNPQIDKEAGVGKVSFHPYIFPNTMYGLGSHYIGGVGVNWFSGLFSGSILEPKYDELNKLAKEAEEIVPGCNNLLMLPFLVGSGSPHNQSTDRGVFLGIDLSTTRGALFRAVLEGIAYNLFETQLVLENMANKQLNIYIGGGGVNIKLWPRIIADVFSRKITILSDKDVSTWGAIRIGAYGVGALDSIYPRIDIDSTETIDFNIDNHHLYEAKFEEYKSIYRTISQWFLKKTNWS